MRALVLDRLSRNIVSPTVPIVCGLSLAFIACIYGSLEPPADDLARLAAEADAAQLQTASAQDVADTISMGMRSSFEPEVAAPPADQSPATPQKPVMKAAEAAPAPAPVPAQKVAALEPKLEPQAGTTVVEKQASPIEESEATPLPPRRPGKVAALVNRAEEALARRLAHRDGEDAANSAIDNRNIFEKLFGSASAPAEKQGQALAYASPDAGGGVTSIAKTATESQDSAKVGSDRFTAVYDISAGTVYMPDGRSSRRIPASARLDNPAAVPSTCADRRRRTLYSLDAARGAVPWRRGRFG